MESSTPRRVLIVAYRTAATPALLEAVRDRAARAPARFTLLVPRPYWDPDTEEAALTLELALPLLDQAADDRVEGLVGDPDPFVAVQDALAVALAEALELAPVSKLLCASDAARTPELFLLAAIWWRDALAAVLPEALPAAEAEAAARMILHENARALYRLSG